MKVWSVCNQKGGVGKTTTVVALGGLLTGWGMRTLLVDLDPHASLTTYFQLQPNEPKTGAYSWFRDATAKRPAHLEDNIYSTRLEGLDVLPAVPALATLERQANAVGGMGLVIKQGLERLADRYDYVLIDSPPMLGVLMVNALAACERLIIPVLAEFLAVNGLERMLQTLEMIHRSKGLSIPYTIVPTMFDRRTRSAIHTLDTLKERFPRRVSTAVIPVDTRLRDASRQGIPPSVAFPKTRAVQAYAQLLESLTPRLQAAAARRAARA